MLCLLVDYLNRQSGQGTSDDLKSKDFKRELEEKERSLGHEHGKRGILSSSKSLSSSKKSRIEALLAPDVDDADEDDYGGESSEDESDEDDTAELLAELNRIKRERATEEAKKDSERKVQEEKIRMENILSGNPLLSAGKSDFKVKRRWDDDVVFKNCARSEPDKSKTPFINDTLRSDFHKKFMEKYIK